MSKLEISSVFYCLRSTKTNRNTAILIFKDFDNCNYKIAYFT